MKVLCLHGMGTNSEIFKAQTSSFRSMLPSHFQFEFMDGEHDCEAADGIGGVYPGPYSCWYPFPPTLDNVSEAHELIWDIINEEGPFDAVMGFSQGAALAASLLLHHQIEKPLEPSPFRLAIFICGSLPFSVNEMSGFDLTDLFASTNDPISGDIEQWHSSMAYKVEVQKASYFALPERLDLSESFSTLPSSVSTTPRRSISPDSSGDDTAPETPITPFSPDQHENFSKGLPIRSLDAKIEAVAQAMESHGDKIRRFHPTIDSVRINIPTAHIYGKNDPYFSQSLQLVNMCQKDLVSVLDHGGAHDVPRSFGVGKSIGAVIEKTITRSELMI